MDFRVPRPKLLFTSRPQFSCRDSIHVATSISCRDINLWPCLFQVIACDVVTLWSCRDIHSSTLQSSIVAPDIATLLLLSRHHFKSPAPFHWWLWCRDIISWYCTFERVYPDVVTSRCCRDIGSSLLHPSTGCCDVATSVFL